VLLHQCPDETGNSINAEEQILRGQLADTEKQIANITEALAIRMNKPLVIKQETLLAEAETIKAKLQLVSAKTVSVKGSTERLNDIVKGLNGLADNQELRGKVQDWIREGVNRIEVNRVDRNYSVDLKNGNFIRMGFDGSVLECKSLTALFGNLKVEAVTIAAGQ
jgi:hypothetical protein